MLPDYGCVLLNVNLVCREAQTVFFRIMPVKRGNAGVGEQVENTDSAAVGKAEQEGVEHPVCFEQGVNGFEHFQFQHFSPGATPVP